MTCNLWPRPRKTLYLVSYRYINNTCETERVPNRTFQLSTTQ